jgi:hypothetical protein
MSWHQLDVNKTLHKLTNSKEGLTDQEAKTLSVVWTFQSIIFSVLVIGRAAEAQFLVSQDQIVALTDIRGIAM